MKYSRLAVFSNGDMYNSIIQSLNLTYISSYIWLGAQAQSGGMSLADYRWMTDANHTGSQVSASSTPPVGASGGMPLCLSIRSAAPYVFYGYTCTVVMAGICEFGKVWSILLFHLRISTRFNVRLR